MEGTGSVLLVNNNTNNNINNDLIRIYQKDVRFLSPREIANLHCFPNDFEFPKEITTSQGWRLIGNSLNVAIVAVLIKLLTS